MLDFQFILIVRLGADCRRHGRLDQFRIERRLVLIGNANLHFLNLLLRLRIHDHRQYDGSKASQSDGTNQAAPGPFFQLQMRVGRVSHSYLKKYTILGNKRYGAQGRFLISRNTAATV